jgi:4-alpha-glucanotransferase
MTFTPRSAKDRRTLRYVARLWGIEPAYYDTGKKLVASSHLAMVKLLENLSETPIDDLKDLVKICQKRHKQNLTQIIQPVCVVDEKTAQCVWLFVKEAELKQLRIELMTEKGKQYPVDFNQLGVRRCGFRHFGTQRFERIVIEIHPRLSLGYHDLTVFAGTRKATSRIICAPKSLGDKAFVKRIQFGFGGFAPLYALKSREGHGIGSFKELNVAHKWMKRHKGHWIGSTPLLALNYDAKPFDPSPYSPVSKLFWNEIYLDIDALLKAYPKSKANALVRSTTYDQERASLNALEYVDYQGVYGQKKETLQLLADEFFKRGDDKKSAFKAFIQTNPEAMSYAKFRSKLKGDTQYHLYVQFELERQLGKIDSLYLDFPVGVSRSSFDCKHYPDHFLKHTSAGAPPDQLFVGGQNWGFFPYHPSKIREQGYRYFIRSLQNHCKHTSLLRIDHVMGFHRIFAIPDGLKATDGAYIRFRSDEFYAVLMLEALRNKTAIVGEDLGTVPNHVRSQMHTRGIKGMWVYEFECYGPVGKTLRDIPASCLAGLNTHDTVPFAGFWQGNDLDVLEKNGFIDDKSRKMQLKSRQGAQKRWLEFLKLEKNLPTPFVKGGKITFLEAVLGALAKSRVELLQINLEDLWLETLPQNMPGTTSQYPNWQKKFRFNIEEWTKQKDINQAMEKVSKSRRQARTQFGAKR